MKNSVKKLKNAYNEAKNCLSRRRVLFCGYLRSKSFTCPPLEGLFFISLVEPKAKSRKAGTLQFFLCQDKKNIILLKTYKLKFPLILVGAVPLSPPLLLGEGAGG